jgi:LPXTG-site transpeptidase (sortase) family protein
MVVEKSNTPKSMTEKKFQTNKSDVSVSTPWARVAAGIAIVVIGLGLLLVVFYLSGQMPESAASQLDKLFAPTKQSTETGEPKSVFESKLKPLFATPTTLVIKSPTTNIELDLIAVGVDEGGALSSPENWNEGGWYLRSAKPGETGNIIINAHYDTNYGAPAAFWQLKNVKVNDKVYLVDELGKYYAYEVADLFYVDIQDPDRLKIFEEVDDMSELTLITCGGIYLTGEGYNKRLVVKASLIDE